MHSLRSLQKNFQEYLLTQNPKIQSAIITTNKLSAHTRLEIYRDAYFLRLLETLEQDYAVLRAIMGEHEFNYLAYCYINAFPSQYRSMRWFGKNLLDFMQHTLPYSNQYSLVEIAQFEWLLTEVFDAKNSSHLPLETMAAIPPEKWPTLQFKLNPSIRQLNTGWNTIEIWEKFKENQTCLPSKQLNAPQTWLIWRKKLDIQFYILSIDEAHMLDAITHGDNFGTICANLCEWIEEDKVAMHAAQLLKRFIIDELIIQIEL